MKCLVIGASAGLGRAITEALAARGHTLSIVSSDGNDLMSMAVHFSINPGKIASLRVPALQSSVLLPFPDE